MDRSSHWLMAVDSGIHAPSLTRPWCQTQLPIPLSLPHLLSWQRAAEAINLATKASCVNIIYSFISVRQLGSNRYCFTANHWQVTDHSNDDGRDDVDDGCVGRDLCETWDETGRQQSNSGDWQWGKNPQPLADVLRQTRHLPPTHTHT